LIGPHPSRQKSPIVEAHPERVVLESVSAVILPQVMDS
jgi:hypothetical protein